jgi:PTH2 family peptidyl-tRNA hydrolase
MSIYNFKYKQVIVIRRDLVMSPAKLGVQVAHGAIESYLRTDPCIRDEWYMEGMRKIVLMVDTVGDLEDLMMECESAKCIIDFGLTELEPNTITGISYPIMTNEDIDKFTVGLRLYK